MRPGKIGLVTWGDHRAREHPCQILTEATHGEPGKNGNYDRDPFPWLRQTPMSYEGRERGTGRYDGHPDRRPYRSAQEPQPGVPELDRNESGLQQAYRRRQGRKDGRSAPEPLQAVSRIAAIAPKGAGDVGEDVLRQRLAE